MSARCNPAAASPLAARVGYVPRCHDAERWCVRPCVAGCGDETASDLGLCSGCFGDVARGAASWPRVEPPAACVRLRP